MSMESKQQTFSFWYFIIAMIVLLVVESFFLSPHAETLSYSEFKVLLKAGKVSNLTLGERDISGRGAAGGPEGKGSGGDGRL